jgi:hypothetical protein
MAGHIFSVHSGSTWDDGMQWALYAEMKVNIDLFLEIHLKKNNVELAIKRL